MSPEWARRRISVLGLSTHCLVKVREAIRAELETYTKGDFVELPMPALIAAGVRV